jgi:hypothetical protein
MMGEIRNVVTFNSNNAVGRGILDEFVCSFKDGTGMVGLG